MSATPAPMPPPRRHPVTEYELNMRPSHSLLSIAAAVVLAMSLAGCSKIPNRRPRPQAAAGHRQARRQPAEDR
jgi:hypothetical protein